MAGRTSLPESEEARHNEVPEGDEARKGEGEDGRTAVQATRPVNPDGEPIPPAIWGAARHSTRSDQVTISNREIPDEFKQAQAQGGGQQLGGGAEAGDQDAAAAAAAPGVMAMPRIRASTKARPAAPMRRLSIRRAANCRAASVSTWSRAGGARRRGRLRSRAA
jgi:hypothetical protein